FSAEGLEIVKSRAEICSLKSEVEALENELEIEQDHAKNMDKEREKDEEIKNLKENIATISQIVEKEYQLRATSAKIIRALEKKNANYQRAGMIGITVVG
ncbi:32501_t:CDS:2, partial [Racocetra persica]